MHRHSLTQLHQAITCKYSLKNNPCVQIASFFSSLLPPCYNLAVFFFAKNPSFLSTSSDSYFTISIFSCEFLVQQKV